MENKLTKANEARNSGAEGSSQIVIDTVKKTKKNEPKMFPPLMLVDKEAFDVKPGTEDAANTKYIMKEFWKSPNSKIIVAKK